jgi:hypothetical protein
MVTVIDISSYDLAVIRISDGKKFKAKRIESHRYKILIDEEKGEVLEITDYTLKKEFKKCKEAAKKKKRLFKRIA